MRSTQHNRRNRRGAALLWMAITLPVLIGFVGLGIDTAWCVLVGHQLQNTADAAALAAAHELNGGASSARAAAVSIGALNTVAGEPLTLDSNAANAVTGDVVVGRYDRSTATFTAMAAAPNAVRVTARRTDASANGGVPLIFGSALGFGAIDMERSAIAMYTGGTGIGLIVLNETDACSLSISGNVDLSGGSVQVNSSDPCAVCSNGGPTIDCPVMTAAGGFCLDDNTDFSGVAYPEAGVVPDPLAGLPDPPMGATQPDVSKSNSQTISPGYYPNGIERTGGTLTCLPGVYYIDDVDGDSCNSAPGLSITGGSLFATGCMFYIKHGKIDLRGNGTMMIAAPTSGTYEGVSVFQARDNNCAGEINGTDHFELLGTLYMPVAQITLNGNARTFFEQIIAYQVVIGGNADVTINYDPTGTPEPIKVFLIE